MAIIRSKIARQLLAAGGVSLDDAKAMAPQGEFLAYINPKEAQMLKDAGGSGIMTPMGIPSFVDFTDSSQGISAADTFSSAESGGASNPSGFGNDGGGDNDNITFTSPKAIGPGTNPVVTYDTGPGRTTRNFMKTFSFLQNPLFGLFANTAINNERAREQALANARLSGSFMLPNQLPMRMTRNNTNRFNNEDDGDNQIVKPMIPKLPTDIEPEKSDYEEFVQRFTLPERFRLAEGGEPRQAYGLGKLVKKVTGAVKKVAKSDLGKAALIAGTGYYLGGGNMGPFQKFLPTMRYGNAAGTGFGFGNILPNILGSVGASGLAEKAFTMGTAGKIATGIGATALAAGFLTPKEEQEVDSLSKRIADRTGIDVEQIRKEVQQAYASGNTEALRTKYPFLPPETAVAADGGRIGFDNGGIMMASNMENDKILEDLFEKYLDMGLSPKDAAEAAQKEFDRMSKKQDMDRTMAAGGGMMNPNDEMLDLGGNEMDLRGGGFVPIGEYEKKDDVPARLSKNEFVFTADAVRAAGGGSVDRGADLMYKTMKQLENKVV